MTVHDDASTSTMAAYARPGLQFGDRGGGGTRRDLGRREAPRHDKGAGACGEPDHGDVVPDGSWPAGFIVDCGTLAPSEPVWNRLPGVYGLDQWCVAGCDWWRQRTRQLREQKRTSSVPSVAT